MESLEISPKGFKQFLFLLVLMLFVAMLELYRI